MSREQNINEIIKSFKLDTNLISDGYHTFGELYEHRIVLYMALCKKTYEARTEDEHPVWMSAAHSDGSVWDGWFLLGIYTNPGDQITYHLPTEYWAECTLFANQLDKAPSFDGHTSQDVLNRLKAL